MTTYKVYWVLEDGFRGYTFIEVSDKFGRKKASEARKKFFELGYAGTIIKVIKDC